MENFFVSNRFVLLISFADDVIECGCNAIVSTRGTENTATHSPALLCIQSNLGLGDIVFNILHGNYGKEKRRRRQRTYVQISARQSFYLVSVSKMLEDFYFYFICFQSPGSIQCGF